MAASGVRPRASARPQRRLRDWSSVQVSTRSPSPASPMKVSLARTERDAEPRHLAQAARDQCDARVGAEAEAIRQAGADGDARSSPRRRSRRRRCRSTHRCGSSARPDPPPCAWRMPRRRRPPPSRWAGPRRLPSRTWGRTAPRRCGRRRAPRAPPGAAAVRCRARSPWWPRPRACSARGAARALRAARGSRCSARRSARRLTPCERASSRVGDLRDASGNGASGR